MTGLSPFTIKGSATQRIHARARSAQVLLAEAERVGARRVFVLAGPTLANQMPHVHALEQALGSRHAGTFAGIRPHTPVDDVVSAVLAAREASTDLIVTVGGGAQTDAGKILVLALKAGVRDREGLRDLSRRCGWERSDVNEPALTPSVPLISIPTTLSGGEFSAGGSAADEEGRKWPFLHRDCAPLSVILDPWISMATPEDLWLSTGIRAVDHAVEALASLRSNPLCNAFAQSALRLLAPALRAVKSDTTDLEARSNCQLGVYLSMLPIASGVPMGASHAIGHALGTLGHVAHGHTSCILMPAVQHWNASAIPDQQAQISEALGDSGKPAGDLLSALVRDLGQPSSLAEVGVGADPVMLRHIAELALPTPWIGTNPRPITSAEDIEEILGMVASRPVEASSAGICEDR